MFRFHKVSLTQESNVPNQLLQHTDQWTHKDKIWNLKLKFGTYAILVIKFEETLWEHATKIQHGVNCLFVLVSYNLALEKYEKKIL